MAVPHVSVVIPIFNGRKYLESSLQSVLQSTYPDFEIVAIDDGSTDGSNIILADFAKRYPSRVHFHRFESNRGMDIAMNYGISTTASGPYIARINQDDEMLPTRLSRQAAFLDSNPDVVAVGGQMALIDDLGKEFGRISYPLHDARLRSRWMKISPFGDPCVTYRKRVWETVGGYNQHFWPSDDLALWFLMARHGTLANLPDVVTRMRWHKGGGSFSRYRLMVRKQLAVRFWAWRCLHNRISPGDVLFALAIVICGMILPPFLNWQAYRLVKKFIP